jgi:hypothetical protein
VGVAGVVVASVNSDSALASCEQDRRTFLYIFGSLALFECALWIIMTILFCVDDDNKLTLIFEALVGILTFGNVVTTLVFAGNAAFNPCSSAINYPLWATTLAFFIIYIIMIPIFFGMTVCFTYGIGNK